MIIGSTKEDLTLEKRVAITPDSAKNIMNLGLKVIIEKNAGSGVVPYLPLPELKKKAIN